VGDLRNAKLIARLPCSRPSDERPRLPRRSTIRRHGVACLRRPGDRSTRIAAPVASGEGIRKGRRHHKQGAPISGLTSAATVWAPAAAAHSLGAGCSPRRGMLAVAVNLALRPLGLVLDRAPKRAGKRPRPTAGSWSLAARATRPRSARSPPTPPTGRPSCCSPWPRGRVERPALVIASLSGREGRPTEAAIARIVTTPEILDVLTRAEPPATDCKTASTACHVVRAGGR